MVCTTFTLRAPFTDAEAFRPLRGTTIHQDRLGFCA
jgi:hypothetical protein